MRHLTSSFPELGKSNALSLSGTFLTSGQTCLGLCNARINLTSHPDGWGKMLGRVLCGAGRACCNLGMDLAWTFLTLGRTCLRCKTRRNLTSHIGVPDKGCGDLG